MDLRPSSAHVWTKCAIQPLMASRMPPEVPSDPAREGTCAAWLAEMVLTKQAPTAADMIGAIHENGWVVDAEMAYHIQPYIDKVRSHGGTVHTERKVILNQHIKGTPDAFAVLDAEGVLRVDDLKYGYLIVEPFQLPQTAIYTGAILRMLTARDVVIRRVVIGIYQPRSWHPAGIYRTWVTNPEELMAFVRWIEAQGELCQNPNAMATPGEHCEYCPAASTCAAVAHEGYRVHSMLVAETQRHMSATEAVNELAFLDMIEKMISGRKKAVEAEVEARIQKAEHFPGWHLEERRGNRRFKFDPLMVRITTGVDPRAMKVVSPAELERMGADPAKVALVSEMPRIAPKLKRVSKNYYANLFNVKG